MKGFDYVQNVNQGNKFTFNGQTEKETKLNLHWHETAFRSYDPQLGRFHQIDPLADLFIGINPYQFGYNNPIMFNDPTGLASPTPSPSIGKNPLPEIGWISVDPFTAMSMLNQHFKGKNNGRGCCPDNGGKRQEARNAPTIVPVGKIPYNRSIWDKVIDASNKFLKRVANFGGARWLTAGTVFVGAMLKPANGDDNAKRIHEAFDKQNKENNRRRIAAEEDIPIFYVRESDYPDIYLNTVTGFTNRGISLDSYDILTYAGAPKTSDDRKAKRDRRDAAYGHMPNAQDGYSWDEYPYASTLEGGLGATVAEVPIWQQNIQKILLSSFYRANKMKLGSKFKVKLVPNETK
ncbi:RHS repeat-associated core domain-containing protein [Thermoflexibacter ruber]|nr:RHS repeat-associated core domain-containing protein [Thermoflexibacter ruber]